MTNGLSFICLKCVLEHMEFNKRLHISPRCPALRRLEKNVPFIIDYLHLHLQNSKITINDITYEVNNLEQMPTEIIFRGNSSGRILTRHVPVHRNQLAAMKHVTNYLLGGRRDIRVHRLDINLVHENVLVLPVGLKLRVNRLDTQEYDIDRVSHFLHESSFPLKSLTTVIWRPHYPEHPIIQSAEKLTVLNAYSGETTEFWFGELLKLTNKHVEFKYEWFSHHRTMTLIRSIIDNDREIGTCIEINLNSGYAFHLLKAIKERFNGAIVHLKEGSGFFTNFQCISIPMNLTSEICIFGSDEGFPGLRKVQIKVVPIGSFPETKGNYDGFWYMLKYAINFYFWLVTLGWGCFWPVPKIFFNCLFALFMRVLKFW